MLLHFPWRDVQYFGGGAGFMTMSSQHPSAVDRLTQSVRDGCWQQAGVSDAAGRAGQLVGGRLERAAVPVGVVPVRVPADRQDGDREDAARTLGTMR